MEENNSESHNSMIPIRFQCGERNGFEIEMEELATVQDMKQKLKHDYGYVKPWLIFSGKVLKDDQVLKDVFKGFDIEPKIIRLFENMKAKERQQLSSSSSSSNNLSSSSSQINYSSSASSSLSSHKAAQNSTQKDNGQSIRSISWGKSPKRDINSDSSSKEENENNENRHQSNLESMANRPKETAGSSSVSSSHNHFNNENINITNNNIGSSPNSSSSADLQQRQYQTQNQQPNYQSSYSTHSTPYQNYLSTMNYYYWMYQQQQQQQQLIYQTIQQQQQQQQNTTSAESYAQPPLYQYVQNQQFQQPHQYLYNQQFQQPRNQFGEPQQQQQQNNQQEQGQGQQNNRNRQVFRIQWRINLNDVFGFVLRAGLLAFVFAQSGNLKSFFLLFGLLGIFYLIQNDYIRIPFRLDRYNLNGERRERQREREREREPRQQRDNDQEQPEEQNHAAQEQGGERREGEVEPHFAGEQDQQRFPNLRHRRPNLNNGDDNPVHGLGEQRFHPPEPQEDGRTPQIHEEGERPNDEPPSFWRTLELIVVTFFISLLPSWQPPREPLYRRHPREEDGEREEEDIEVRNGEARQNNVNNNDNDNDDNYNNENNNDDNENQHEHQD